MKAYNLIYNRTLTAGTHIREAEVEAKEMPNSKGYYEIPDADGVNHYGTREDLFDKLMFSGFGYVFADDRDKAYAVLLRDLKEKREELMREVNAVVEDIATVMDARDGIV